MTFRSSRTRCWPARSPISSSATKSRPSFTRRSPKCWCSCCGCRGTLANNFAGCRHPFTTMPDASSPPHEQGAALIDRRRVLYLLSALAVVPSRGFANVAPQRSEIRDGLAKHFSDAGTVGTFVGYKTDDYL